MPLFQKSVVKKYLDQITDIRIDALYKHYLNNYGNADKIEIIRQSKEEQYQEVFLRDVFVDLLGYIINPDPGYNLTTEFKNLDDSKKADGAILKDARAVGVIELKSTKTVNLEDVKTQAFNYKNHQPGCKYIITSNFEKLWFYIEDAAEHEEFNLFSMDKEQFRMLYLCLSADNIINNIPFKIKQDSKLHEENISKILYKDYSEFKHKLFENLIKNNPERDKLTLLKNSQKLLDRMLFIFFAEDKGLIPPNTISRIVDDFRKLKKLDAYQPLYERLKLYFKYIDSGHNEDPVISGYNGELFKPDPELDSLIIDDKVLIDDTVHLSAYDFDSEVDVNILGHIFEHSLNEIEALQAEIKGEEFKAQTSKRKKDGVYYTPKYITKYIVENTLGKLCEEKKEELCLTGVKLDSNLMHRKGKKLTKDQEDLLVRLIEYREYLISLKICDPACGSGAFLNQALEYLIAEHSFIDANRRILEKDAMGLYDIEQSILENNIYGVDINDEAVEIAKLSLWLRTARKGRKLSSLNTKIKCGNSLIDDPEVAGNKAFKWEEEFPEVFRPKELAAFHVTWSTYNSRYTDDRAREDEPMLNSESRNKIAELLDEKIGKENYRVIAANVLNDHVHILLVCEENEVGRISGQLKGYSSHGLHSWNNTVDGVENVLNPTVNRGAADMNNCGVENVDLNPTVNRGAADVNNCRAAVVNNRGTEEVVLNPTVIRGAAVVNNRGTGDINDNRGPGVQNDINDNRGPGVHPRVPTQHQNHRDTDHYIDYNAVPADYSDGTRRKLWQKGYSSTLVRDDVHFANIVSYINNNHIKHENEALNYKFSKLTPQSQAFAPAYAGGFDVVIGNPPYGALFNSISKEYLIKKFNISPAILDSYILFLLSIPRLLKKLGIYSLITPSTWLYMNQFKIIRSYLLRQMSLLETVLFRDSIFDDATVETCITTFCSFFNQDSIYHFIEKKKNSSNHIQIRQNDILFSKDKNLLLTKNEIENIFRKMLSETYEFGYVADIVCGLTPYRIGKGKPKQTKEIVKKKLFDATYKKDSTYRQYLMGRDFNRYYWNIETKRWISYGNWLAEPRYAAPFNDPLKIVIRQTADSIIAHLDCNKYISLKNVHNVRIKKDFLEIKYILTLLNSKAITWWYRRLIPEKGRVYAEVKVVNLKRLPIKCIEIEQQQPFIQKADIMLDRNQELQVLKDNFLNFLQTKFDIEKLSKKLQDWYLLSSKDFLKELAKKKVKLSLEDEMAWTELFEKQKKEALAVKEIIDRTDKEIDQMVYELYGLTDEEIKIVEGE